MVLSARRPLILVATAACCLLPGLAPAQKKVPGEKWRHTMSMQMEGFSMPARTQELCAPVGRAQDTLMKPDDKNCTVSDVQRSGDTMRARIACTGKDAMEGTVEIRTLGDRVQGTTRVKSKDGEMTMKFESQKLPGTCEALDYSDYKPPVANAPAVDPEAMCKQAAADFQKAPGRVVIATGYYVGARAPCVKSATFKSFCEAVGSHEGFRALDDAERSMSGRPMSAETKAQAAASGLSAGEAPLQESLKACGLGAPDAQRGKLLASAPASNQWPFLLRYGDEAEFQVVAGWAKRECTGRDFTSSPNRSFNAMCLGYGPALVKGNRKAVMAKFSGSCSGDCDAAGSGGEPVRAGAEGSTPAANPGDAAKDAAKEAVDKGKKLLRGLFGG